MTLQKQRVPVPLSKGVDSKTDSKLTPGNISVMNMIQQKSGALSKVEGYSRIGSVIGDIFKLEPYQNELLVFSSYALYSYNQSSNVFLPKGELINVTTENKTVIANSYEQTSAQGALSSADKLCFVWEDTRGGVYYLVKDRVTGLTTTNNTQIAQDLTHPSVYSINDTFYIVCYNTVSQKLVCYLLTDSGLQTPIEIISNVNTTTPIYDIVKVGAKAVIVYKDTSNYLTLAYIDGDGELGSDLSGSSDPVQYTTASSPSSFCIAYDGTSLLNLNWYDASGVDTVLLNMDFSNSTSPAAMDTDTTTAKPNMTSVWNEVSGEFEVFIEYAPAAALNHLIKRGTINRATSTITSANFYIYSLGLASKAYRADSVTRFLAAYESAANLQNTYFIVGSNEDRLTGAGWGIGWGEYWGGDGVVGIPEARILPDVAFGHPERDNQLPSVIPISSSELVVVALKQNRIVSSNVESLTLAGIEQVNLSLNTQSIGQSAELGQNLHIPGGFLKIYDGEDVVEHNFHLWPDALTVGNSATAGSVANGTYQYIAVYEWIDSKGQIHRSAPSIAVSHTVSGGPKGVDVTVPCLRVTQKGNVQVGIYRTVASGSLFYKVSSDTAPTYSSPSADTVTFLDTLADASITSRPLLYTTAQLENYSPVSSNVSAVFQNRVFIADKNELFYSRQHFVGEGVNFNSALYISVPPDGGDITGLAVLDEKLMVMKRRAIYVLNGEGPDELGRDANYTLSKLNVDVGCVDSESIVLIPDGLIFKTAKGFYLLDRGLSVSYIGAPVEDYNQYSVNSGQAVVDKNLVRFILDGVNTQLVFDYYHKIWTLQNFNVAGESSTIWGIDGDYVFSTAGSVYQEESGSYAFDGSVINSSVETGWISLAGLSGFQRVYRANIVGNLNGDHRLLVKVYYDYNNDYSEQFSISASQGEAFGGDALWGDSSLWGGGLGNYLYECKPSRQKCTAIKFKIEDQFPESSASAGLNLNMIVLTVGIKEGSNTAVTALT